MNGLKKEKYGRSLHFTVEYPLKDILHAHQRVTSGKKVGKKEDEVEIVKEILS